MKWSLTTNLHLLETDIFKLHNPNSGYLLLDFCKEIEIHVVWKSILRYQFHLRGLFPSDSKWELLCEKFFLKTQPRISSIKFNTFLCMYISRKHRISGRFINEESVWVFSQAPVPGLWITAQHHNIKVPSEDLLLS